MQTHCSPQSLLHTLRFSEPQEPRGCLTPGPLRSACKSLSHTNSKTSWPFCVLNTGQLCELQPFLFMLQRHGTHPCGFVRGPVTGPPCPCHPKNRSREAQPVGEGPVLGAMLWGSACQPPARWL